MYCATSVRAVGKRRRGAMLERTTEGRSLPRVGASGTVTLAGRPSGSMPGVVGLAKGSVGDEDSEVNGSVK